MKVIKIVLTGGPGGGKTDAIKTLKKMFSAEKEVFRYKDYRCLFISETASELIGGGITPRTCATVKDFQDILFNIQIAKEKGLDLSLNSIPSEKFIVFFDRGIIDGGAYITDEEFEDIYTSRNMTFDDMYSRYDAVFSFETPEEFYTTKTNNARSESLEIAKQADRRTAKLWSGHPNMNIIKPKDTYEEKFNEFFEKFEKLVAE